MRGKTHVVAACAVVLACACGTGDTRIDPGDLELRDLLGVAPETAARWDDEQRASARRVFEAALDESGEPIEVSLVGGDTPDEQIAHSLVSLDARRVADGDHALGFVRVQIDGARLAGTTRAAPTLLTLGRDPTPMPSVELDLSSPWRGLPPLSQQVLTALATDAGARAGDRIIVVPASRLPVIASFVARSEPRLLVNPVLLAALDPGAVALAPEAATQELAIKRHDSDTREAAPRVLANNGNPYSFYGSIDECAAAQRTRCDACVGAGDCVPVTTTSDGIAECNMLAADGGRGYYLLCINLSLSISSVDACTADVRPDTCPRDPNAASSLSALEANAVFLDDTQCGNGLDACLAKIYGDSTGNYPGYGIDGGVDGDPPREIDVSCGDSCNGDKSANCEFSPNCSCEGPSCGNSLSCDSSCSSSNSQSGCNDNCQSCSSDDGGSSSSGGSCGGDSSSGGSDCGGSCGDSSGCNGCSDGSSGGGSSGGSCGGSSGGGSSGGDCGGSCGSDSGGGCGGGGGGGDSSCGGGGSSGGGCQVAKRPPNAIFAVALSMTWAILPLPLAAYLRRRSRKKQRKNDDASTDEEVVS